MPIPVVEYEPGLIYRPEQAVEMVAQLIEENSERLGIQFVGKYDERMIPSYPAVVVSAGSTEKELHATHTFAVILRCIIWVYHADITLQHRERSLEDLMLATALTALVEDDFSWKDDNKNERVVFGYIESEVPGVVAPRAGKGTIIVGTKMNWEASTQKRFS